MKLYLFFCLTFFQFIFLMNAQSVSPEYKKMYRLGVQYHKAEDYSISKDLFVKSKAKYANDTMIYYYLGSASYHLKQYDSAYYYLDLAEHNSCKLPQLYYYLACVHHYFERFAKAEKYLQKYKSTISVSASYTRKELPIDYTAEIEKIDKLSKFIQFSRDNKADSLPVVIENVGFPVSTPHSEYAVFPTGKGDTIYYTSRQPGKKNNNPSLFDGKHHENIMYSVLKNGKWQTPEYWSTHQQKDLHEACVGINEKSDTMYLYRSKKSFEMAGDLYTSVRKNDSWSEPKKLEQINTRKWEGCANITFNERWIFFTSDREDGIGGVDIYLSEIQADGSWSEPKNLGNQINTIHDEDAPQIGPDDKTLYFSSKGHEGMGGYDIYMTKYNPFDSSWSEPINMGYPINTPADDIYFNYNPNAKYAWMSSSRHSENYGEYDLYKIHRPFVKKGEMIMRGKVIDARTKKAVPAIINLFKDSSNVSDDLSQSGHSGRYSTVLKSDQPYRAVITAKGYKASEEKIIIPADDEFSFFTFKNFYVNDTSVADTMPAKIMRDHPVELIVKIMEKENKNPISTIVALFEEQESNMIDLIYSDSTGTFRTNLKPGHRYYLKIADENFYPLQDSLYTNSSIKLMYKEYFLEKNLPVENRDSIMKVWENHISKVVLQGKVLDAHTRMPLEALVSVNNNSSTTDNDVTITDASGSFSSVLTRGENYTLNALSEGYQLLFTNLHVPDSAVIHQTIYLSKIVNNYDSLVKLWQSREATGILKLSVNHSISGASLPSTLVLFEEKDTIPINVLHSEGDGKFECRLKKETNYKFLVITNDYGELSESVYFTKADSVLEKKLVIGSPILDIVPEEKTKQLKQSKIAFHGKILDIDTRQPIDALIAVQIESDGLPDEVSASNFDGLFSLNLIKSRTYFFTFASRQYHLLNIEVTASDTLGEQVFYMTRLKEFAISDSVLTRYKRELNSDVTLLGKVVILPEREPYSAFVALYIDGQKEPEQVVPSDENGSFSFKLNHDKQYRVEVLENGFLPIKDKISTSDTNSIYRRTYELKKPVLQAQIAALKNEWKRKAKNIRVIMYGSILENGTNIPVSAMLGVFLKDGKEPLETITSDFNGRFEIRVEANTEYLVRIVSPEYQPFVTTILNTDTSKIIYKVFYLNPNPKRADDIVIQTNAFLTSSDKKVVTQSSIKLSNILFDFNNASLKPQSIKDLEQLRKYLEKNPGITIEISGHTDDVGSNKYNKELSMKRAAAVRQYLISKKIRPSRIKLMNHGEELPVAPNDNDRGRQINRRIEYKVVNNSRDTVVIEYQTGVKLQYSLPTDNWTTPFSIEQLNDIAYFAMKNPGVQLVFRISSTEGASAPATIAAIQKTMITQHLIDKTRIKTISISDKKIKADANVVEVFYFIEK